jgi:hypothetical protein
MRLRPLITLTFALAAGLAGCGSESSEPIAPIGAGELRQVPTTSGSLAGFTYRLEPFLWRDFMPGAGEPGGSPLLAALRVTVDDDTASFPASVTIDRVWIVNGEQVWEARPVEEWPRETSGSVATIEAMARGGPRWGPGIDVDVVVRLSDGRGGTLLLRAAGQPIARTD